MTLEMAWRTRPLQLVLSGGPVTSTPHNRIQWEYNGLRGENRGSIQGSAGFSIKSRNDILFSVGYNQPVTLAWLTSLPTSPGASRCLYYISRTKVWVVGCVCGLLQIPQWWFLSFPLRALGRGVRPKWPLKMVQITFSRTSMKIV